MVSDDICYGIDRWLRVGRVDCYLKAIRQFTGAEERRAGSKATHSFLATPDLFPGTNKPHRYSLRDLRTSLLELWDDVRPCNPRERLLVCLTNDVHPSDRVGSFNRTAIYPL
jgi:hypothetical protein